MKNKDHKWKASSLPHNWVQLNCQLCGEEVIGPHAGPPGSSGFFNVFEKANELDRKGCSALRRSRMQVLEEKMAERKQQLKKLLETML